MRPIPVYSFPDTTATGLDQVPVNSKILIIDSNGSGKPKEVILIANTGITDLTTIATFLDTMTANYKEVSAAGAIGGGNDAVFYENENTVTTSYTITSGKNAMSAGDITIADGVTVTVPSGSRWVIV